MRGTQVDRERAYEAIAAVYRDWGYADLGWTPELVAETERRLAVDDADVWDSSAHFADFALRVLDHLELVEPYRGPGELRPRHESRLGVHSRALVQAEALDLGRMY